MKYKHQEALRLSLVALSEKMITIEVLAHLRGAGILDGPQKQQIEAKTTGYEQNIKLIEMLMQGGSNAFEDFLDVLNQTNQSHLKEIVLYNLGEIERGNVVLNDACTTIKEYYRNALRKYNPFFLDFTFNMETMWINLTLKNNETQTDNYFKLIRNAFELNQMIYVEGKTATGKTLLLRKIACDWSEGRWPEFDLVLLAEFRHLKKKYKSITDVTLAWMQRMLPNCNISPEFSAGKKILLLIDGYDEAKTNQCPELDTYLTENGPKPSLPYYYIIMSRPGKIKDHQESRYALIDILGFEADKQKLAYVSAHFAKHPNKNEQMEIVSRKLQINNNLNKIASTPLYLTFICLVHEKIPDGSNTTIFELYFYVIWWLLDRYRKDHLNSDKEDDVPTMFRYTQYPKEDRRLIIQNHFLEFPLLQKLGKMAFELYDNNNFTEENIKNYEITEGACKVGLLVREDKKKLFWTVTTYEFPHRTVQEFLAGGIYYFWPELFVEHPLLHGKCFNKNFHQKPIIYKDDSEYQMLEMERFACSAELTNSAANPHLPLIKNNLLKFFKKYETLSFDMSLSDSGHKSKLNALLQKCSKVTDLFLYTSEDETQLTEPIDLAGFNALKYIGFHSFHFTSSILPDHYNTNSRSPFFTFHASNQIQKITFLHNKFGSANCFLEMMKNLNNRLNGDLLIHFFNSTIVIANPNVGIKEVGFIMHVQSLKEYNHKIMDFMKNFERETILYSVFMYLCKASTLVLISSDLQLQAQLTFPLLDEVHMLELQKFKFSSEHETYALLLDRMPMLDALRFKYCSFTLPVWQSIVGEIMHSNVEYLSLEIDIPFEEYEDYLIQFHKVLESCHKIAILVISYSFASIKQEKFNMTTILASLARNMVNLTTLNLRKAIYKWTTEISEDDSILILSVCKAGQSRRANFQFIITPMLEKGQSTNQFDDALKRYKEKANQGDTQAQFDLGVVYATGQGAPQSDEEAFKWFLKAANQGLAIAQHDVALHYEKGLGILQSNEEAIKWFKKAAQQGEAKAQYELGVRYDKGQGVPKCNEEAFKWFKKAAEQGYVNAQFNLGVLYSEGKGVAQSNEEAFKWYQKAAEQGSPEAQCNLGVVYSEGKGVAQSNEEAVKWYQKGAEQGFPIPQFNLGVLYSEGKGVAQSNEEAFKWYQKAAEQGSPNAQFNLGFMYSEGKGVAQSNEEAVKWYQKAAEQGFAEAQIKLGFWYERGKGIPQSNEKAVKWYKKAAEQGLAQAQSNLGILYRAGRGIPQSDEEAFKWTHKAAEQGLAEAQSNLGVTYYNGHGVPQSYEEAFKWFQKAAQQGYIQAQCHLGEMYREGHGVPQSDEHAFEWYQKAEEQGSAEAQYTIGVMYHKGRGVPQSDEDAFKWYQKAAEQGFVQAQFNVGFMYHKGRSVPQSYEYAFKWYLQAANQGFPQAQIMLFIVSMQMLKIGLT